MNEVPDIDQIDTSILIGPVRRALDSESAEIRYWNHLPIRYIKTETSNLGLHRFQGVATDQGGDRPWSIVLKAVHAPVNQADQATWNYHRREILSYDTGLLSHLPGCISAPRCLGITQYPNGNCWLWLEDIQDAAGREWSLAEYGQIAHHLGQFNGAYLAGRVLPDRPWLSRNWLRGWLARYDPGNRETLELVRDPHFWEQPVLQSSFRQPITGELLQLWDNHELLLSALDRLPQTFCHLDAYRPNLFLRRDPLGGSRTVAIDWVFTGIASVGEEIANLLSASLIWFEYDAAQAEKLDKAIFSGYLNGLRQAGWQGNAHLVRLGYTAACALRWGVVGVWWMLTLGDPGEQAELEAEWDRPLTELVPQWSRTINYILEMAQEAYRLHNDLL